MIRRTITENILGMLRQFRVLTITGPRQSGKTTLVKSCLPKYQYVNLEFPDVRAHALSDPRDFLHVYKPPVILDEVQRAPDLLSYIQALVDEDDGNGQYVLTGSQQFGMMSTIKQSLAGRTALLSLLPLSLHELAAAGIHHDRDEWIFNGFMPGLFKPQVDVRAFYSAYLQTYVERDLSELRQIHNLSAFEMFVRMLAARVGQLLNLHSMANDIGISSTTLRDWLSLLETSCIVYLLHPYHANIGKRLTKSPKVYFYETGLAAHLLGMRTPEEVALSPSLGGLFENMVIMEAVKTLRNQGLSEMFSFYRDSNGVEIDLLWSPTHALTIPLEIKAARTFSPDMAANIVKAAKHLKGLQSAHVVYAGNSHGKIRGCEYNNFQNTAEVFACQKGETRSGLSSPQET